MLFDVHVLVLCIIDLYIQEIEWLQIGVWVDSIHYSSIASQTL